MKFDWLRSRKFWLFLIGGILIALLASNLPLQKTFESFRQGLPRLGLLAVPVFILLYLIATILGLPNLVLILASGSLFGLFQGIAVASIADTLGAIACFWLGRTIARDRIKRWLTKNPTFAQLDQAVGKKGWKLLLLTRLSPLVPSNVLNYGFSCTKVNFWQYCFFSWLGMLPVISLYVYLGTFGARLLQDGLTPGKLALQLFGLALTAVAALYTTRLARRSLQPDCEPEKSNQEAKQI